VVFRRSGQFVRGAFFEDADFASLALPFKLDADERGKGPTALLLHALGEIVPGAASLWPINRQKPASAQATFDHLRRIRHNGLPLDQFGLWNVLADVVSNEAYALLASTLGTISLFRNVNAFDGVWNLSHEIGDGGGFTLVDGYQSLPLELQARAQRNGVAVCLNHRLDAVSRHGANLRLTFTGPNGEAIEKRARQVILALPQRALQLLNLGDDLFEDASEFRRVRDRAVLPMRSCKVFLTYDHAWWRDAAANEIVARLCRFKGVRDAMLLASLVHPSLLRAEFPPLRSLLFDGAGADVLNSPIFGRQKELGDVLARLGGTRLLTIVGPGGNGKTRLALQVGAEVTARQPVCFASLDAASRDADLPSTLAAALRLQLVAGRGGEEQLIDYLRDKQMLLVLDNAETIAGRAALVGQIVAACPRLTVLVTSREPLIVENEVIVHLQGIDLLDSRGQLSVRLCRSVDLPRRRSRKNRL
jgi:hypothetical protein